MKNFLKATVDLAKAGVEAVGDAAEAVVDYAEKTAEDNKDLIDRVKTGTASVASAAGKVAAEVVDTTAAAVKGAVDGVKNKDK